MRDSVARVRKSMVKLALKQLNHFTHHRIDHGTTERAQTGVNVMPWIFNLRSQGCSGTFQKYFDEFELIDAIKHLRDKERNLWIHDASLLQWSEVSHLSEKEKKLAGIT